MFEAKLGIYTLVFCNLLCNLCKSFKNVEYDGQKQFGLQTSTSTASKGAGPKGSTAGDSLANCNFNQMWCGDTT